MLDLERPETWHPAARALPYRHDRRALELPDGKLVRLGPLLVGLLACLLERPVAHVETMLERAYGGSGQRAPGDERSALTQLVVQLRDALALVGWVVLTVHGWGYQIEHDEAAAAQRRAGLGRQRNQFQAAAKPARPITRAELEAMRERIDRALTLYQREGAADGEEGSTGGP